MPVGWDKVPLTPVTTGTSEDNKTGGWRTFRPVWSEDKCTFCNICWKVCPDVAVTVTPEKVVFDFEHCKGCGVCANECPTDSIVMELEE